MREGSGDESNEVVLDKKYKCNNKYDYLGQYNIVVDIG